MTDESLPKAIISPMESSIGKEEEKLKKKIKNKPQPVVTDIAKQGKKFNFNVEKFMPILLFVGEVILYGLMITLILMNFGVKPTFYSWAGWGCLWWFIRIKLTELFKEFKK